MDRMLVIFFDTEAQAIEGSNALVDLDERGSVSLYAHAIIAKNADGVTSVKKTDDFGPYRTLAGLEIGAFIGLFGGPGALPIGAAVGSVGGGALDIRNAVTTDDFIRDVARKLRPNKFAVIAEVHEDSPMSVDMRMKDVGGTISRHALSDVERTLRKEHIASIKADLAQRKEELSHAHASRKAKLQEQINRLESWLQQPVRQPEQRSEPEQLREKPDTDIVGAKPSTLKEKAS